MFCFYLAGVQNATVGISKRRIVVALYDYKSRDESDLNFMKGDRMEVIDDTESDWWRVINLNTRQEGLIPLNFVAEERSVNSEEYVYLYKILYLYIYVYIFEITFYTLSFLVGFSRMFYVRKPTSYY